MNIIIYFYFSMVKTIFENIVGKQLRMWILIYINIKVTNWIIMRPYNDRLLVFISDVKILKTLLNRWKIADSSMLAASEPHSTIK